MLKKLFEKVYETEVYTELDYEFVEKFLEKKHNGMKGLCTAIAKNIGGETVVGRNMDLYICKKPAYVIRTEVPGDLKTVSLSYYFGEENPDCSVVEEQGLGEEIKKLLPFYSTDVMNEKGFYIETNMRLGEYDSEGKSKFLCKGTNSNSDIRLCSMVLPRYIAQKCSTVKEALQFVKTLDIYTPNGKMMDWNFCFMLADATGDYGVLEIAADKISWLDKQPVQTNFYVSDGFYKEQRYKIGVGRYENAMAGYDSVNSEDDMFALIDSVTSYQANVPDICKYDYRTEFSGMKKHWTYEYVTAEENRKEMEDNAYRIWNNLKDLSRKQQEEKGLYWESTFTIIVNCNKRKLKVRFFEDNSKITELTV